LIRDLVNVAPISVLEVSSDPGVTIVQELGFSQLKILEAQFKRSVYEESPNVSMKNHA
jgi:hypothetical protein